MACALLCSVLCLPGCASDGEPPFEEPLDDGSEVPFAETELTLDAPEAAGGFQVTTLGAVIAPYDESEWCEVVTVPGEPGEEWSIDRIETVHTPFIHHYFIMAAHLGSASEQVMEDGTRVRCNGGAHGVYGTDLDPVLISGLGTQSNRGEARMPEGVAVKLYGGQKIAINYHFLNVTDAPVDARQKFNFYRSEQEGPLTALQYFAFNNTGLHIPAHGTFSTQMARGFSQDVYVSLLARHTHGLGREFHVWWHGGDRDGELVYTSHDIELDAFHPFDEPIRIPRGQGFRFECNFVNPTNRSVGVGPRAVDEMCMLLGAWWPANPNEAPKSQNYYKF